MHVCDISLITELEEINGSFGNATKIKSNWNFFLIRS